MASNYSSSSIFFAPTRKSRRTRTIRFFDEKADGATADANNNGASKIPQEPPTSPKDILASDLKLAMELQREENLRALQEAAKRRNDQIQAGRNRTGRSCAHGFGLGTKGVACHADRDLIAEQQESERAEAEAGAVEVKYVAEDGGSCCGGDGADVSKTDADTHSTCSDASSMGSTPPRRRNRTRTRQTSSGVAAMRGVAPPLGYRLNSGLTENPRSDDEDDVEDSDDVGPEEDRSESSPLRSTTNTHIDTDAIANEESVGHCNQDCSSTSSSSSSTPTKRNTSTTSVVHTSPARNTMLTPPPSILKNRLTKRPPSDLNLVGRVGTADTVDTVESAEGSSTTTTPTSTASTNTHKQPAWLEEMEKERALKKNAEDAGKAAEKLLADTLRHNDSARRRSGFGLFAPTWGAKGSPGRSSGGGTVSYDRRNLPTTY